MKAIVVGAGIGGLTAAIALRRAGIDVAVLERVRDLHDVQAGGAIHLWHNGMRGLQRLGVAERVEALGGRGAVLERTEFCNRSGKRLFGWSAADEERRLGAPTVGVVRPGLHAVLLEALGSDAISPGSTCTGFTETADGVTALLDGGRTAEGDVLVGADGIRSAVRAQLLRDGEPAYAGYASFQGLAEFPPDRAPIGLLRVLFGPGARFLYYRVSETELYWEGIVSAERGAAVGEGERKPAVLRSFAGWAEPVEEIVDATEAGAVTRTEIFHRPPIKRWGEGRATLLGDAGHAMTNAMGQGANQAIEDAVVLASCLGAEADPSAALRAYEARRIARTAKVVKLSWNLTRLAQWRRPWACAARDRLLWAASPLILAGQRKDMDYRF
jgi:2-polyprenyl-6-methoxyphenol hydroxylase-like FAD-dependent oxidoreductase